MLRLHSRHINSSFCAHGLAPSAAALLNDTLTIIMSFEYEGLGRCCPAVESTSMSADQVAPLLDTGSAAVKHVKHLQTGVNRKQSWNQAGFSCMQACHFSNPQLMISHSRSNSEANSAYHPSSALPLNCLMGYYIPLYRTPIMLM